MNTGNKKGKTVIGGIGATSAVLLLFLLAQDSSQAPTASVATPVETKTAKSVQPRKSTRPKLARRSYQPPVRMAAEAISVQFPKPTENTIVIASNAQLVKLDSYQNPLAEDAEKWDCVTDRTTGLVWEVKTSDKGLQDANNYYSWFNTNPILNHGEAGARDNGNCRGGIDCDTQSYINAINTKSLCGYSDWRLPTRKEMLSIVQSRLEENRNTMVDTRFFPRTEGDWYWTSDTDADDAAYAWYVLFYNGRTMKAPKHQAKRIRLVRGSPATRLFKHVAENPETHKKKKLANDRSKPQSQEVTEKGVLTASNISQ